MYSQYTYVSHISCTYLIYHTQWYTHHNTNIMFKNDIIEFHVKCYGILSFHNIWGFWQLSLSLLFLYCFLTHHGTYIIMQYMKTLHVNHNITQFINMCSNTKKHRTFNHIHKSWLLPIIHVHMLFNLHSDAQITHSISTNVHHSGTTSVRFNHIRAHLSICNKLYS